ncbi:hypothetical protein [Streptomyces sp. LN704]|uniref:hypothetical protein n=1 Tax=Streptomyces sp. LN704 TaxID=3112982 RepID=UPI00371207B0
MEIEKQACAPRRLGGDAVLCRLVADVVVADLLVLAYLRHGSPYALCADTPSGFVEDVLGIRTWARLRTILDSVVDQPRVAAPICFGAGARTQIAPLLAVWHVAVQRDTTRYA